MPSRKHKNKHRKVVRTLDSLSVIELFALVTGGCSAKYQYINARSLRDLWTRIRAGGHYDNLCNAIDMESNSSSPPKEVIDTIMKFMKPHSKMASRTAISNMLTSNLNTTVYRDKYITDPSLIEAEYQRFRKGLVLYLNGKWKSNGLRFKDPQKRDNKEA